MKLEAEIDDLKRQLEDELIKTKELGASTIKQLVSEF